MSSFICQNVKMLNFEITKFQIEVYVLKQVIMAELGWIIHKKIKVEIRVEFRKIFRKGGL